MKNKFLRGIRFKVILICIESSLLSMITLFFIYSILTLYKHTIFIRNIINFIKTYISIQQAFLLAGIGLFILYLIILVNILVKYIGKISYSVSQISDGNFDAKIEKITPDELGELASNINNMSTRLQNLIEEERRLTESKNYLITSLSHDLKTPLTSIYGYLEMINKDDYKDEVELRYYSEIAFDKTIQLKKMVEQLFDYTKYNYGNISLEKVKINVKELLKQLVIEYYPYFLQQEVECRLHFNAEKYEIYADSQLLLRVFENLISNAVKYSGENSQYIDIELESVSDKIKVHFINYDNIIPAYQQPYIFNKFYKIEGSRSNDDGSGLGLAIAKTIVELNDGSICVNCHDNKTIFTLTFDKYDYGGNL